MCGINLIVDRNQKLDNSNIRQMNIATRHRGPNGSYYEQLMVNNCRVFLGHNRLKVIDLSNEGNQPFFSHDRRHVLLFNGEVYNYRELKAQLQKKYLFRTSSDTEVLLYWLIEKGAEGIHALEGMFAFVLIDTFTQDILLSRDQSFIKPLYYYQDEHFLLVSSEIRGILASGLVSKKLNAAQIPHYLAFRYANAPQTFYQNIYAVQAASLFDLKSYRLNNILPREPLKTKAPLIHQGEIKENLYRVIEQQLKADVPVGVFLSGGVDSTLLLSIAQQLGIKNLPSFALINASEEQSFGTKDFHFARLAAQQYGSNHQEYTISASDLGNLPAWVACLDQPIGDGAALLTYLLAKKACQQVKVVLSGAGADELFAGYNRHWAFYQYLKKYKLFKAFSPHAQFLSRRLSDGFAHPWRKKFRLMQKFFAQISPDPATTFNNFTRLHSIPLITPQTLDKAPPHIQPTHTTAWLNWCLQYDREHFLANDVLALTDAMSMQHGLEVRVPYLSQTLMQALKKYPTLDLLVNGKKSLLKKWLNEQGGKKYTQRAKEGFGMPFGRWLQQGTLAQITEDLLQPQNLMYEWVDYQGFRQMLGAHQSKKRDYTSEIWAVVVLNYWLKQHF